MPAWGTGGFKTFFHWRGAHQRARAVAPEVALRRLAAAERCGLTYAEYTLELLERGRHLQPTDVDRIAEIKAKRR